MNHVIKRNVCNTDGQAMDRFINNDNSIVTDKQEIVDDFNKFFVNIGPSLAEKIVNPTEECNMNKYI